MVVTCPSCSKRYMLDEALLPKEGRQVRCITCHHIWRQVPEISPTIHPPSFIRTGEVPLATDQSPEKHSSWLRGILSLALLLTCISVFIFGRNFIVMHWPQTEKLYDLIGLHVNLPGSGLTISNASSIMQQDGPLGMIQVKGDIINTSHIVRPIPALKIKFIGDVSHPKCLKNQPSQDCVLDYWEHRLSENSLLPGEQIHFETDPRPRVEGIKHIAVEF